MSKEEKPRADWERIEIEFRAGLLSLRELGARHGVAHVTIAKKAKALGWERDLNAKIQAKADALANKAVANAAANAQRAVSEREVIEATASAIAQIRGQHRADIGRARALSVALLVELESQTGNLPGLEELGEVLRTPNENGVDKLNDIYRAVISLPERTKTMKALSESLKNLVGLEREAYGLANAPSGPAPGADTAIPDDPIEASRAYQRLMSRV